jgi:penicillin-binding protein 1A
MAKKPIRPKGSGPKLTKTAGGGATAAPAPKAAAAKKTTPRKISPKKNALKRGGKKPARRGFWMRRGFWSWTLSSVFALGFIVLAALLHFASGLPSVRGLETASRQPGITIKTEDGLTLASYGDVYGQYVPYEQIPKHLIRAVLATEDRRYFDHNGVDVLGIARAMVANVRAGRMVQGGSTITQQVAKNVFLTPERTLKRKMQELMLSFWLESNFTKEQILAIYLNRVYLGSGNYGIDAASRRYFDKPATQVNLMESAILTGLLKAPSRYSPLSSVDRAKGRAHQVLLNMVDAEYITQADVDMALKTFTPPKLYREGDATGLRYFTDWIVDEVPLYVGQVEGDMTVVTTINTQMQTQAEDAVAAIMDAQSEDKKAGQAALLSMSPDGAIRAMVGGRNYQESQYNRVTQAQRQAGSVFKLFVYLAALEAGATPNVLVVDEEIEVPTHNGRRTWRPKNFDHQFRGEITLREALTHSVNTVSVQLAQAVGLNKVIEMARRLGVAGVPNNPSIALGALEVNLLDMTTAYAHLANNGRGVQPYGIKQIVAQDGKELYTRKGSGLWVVLRESVVQQMNYMLMNVPLEGTGRRAYIGRSMACKTGTSSDFRDAWFIGYTPQLVTGVWVGNDNNTKMKRVTGGNLPAMIWKGYMSQALKGKAALGLAGSDGQFATESESLPWQQNDSDNVLDMFRSSEPGTPMDTRPGANDDRWRDRRREQQERGPELDRGFWDSLFGG